jgi:hypothetical protein
MASSSIRPVLDQKAGNLAKVLEITRHDFGAMGQCDAGDQEIAPADFFQLPVLAQPIELGRGCGIDGDDSESRQIAIALNEPCLRLLQLVSVRCLGDKRKTPQ